MVSKKVPLVTHVNGSREVIGTAEVVGLVPGEKIDVDIENVGANVVDYEVDPNKLNLPDAY